MAVAVPSSQTRNAVITGAASGIGRAIAIRLANDGCNVVANDLPYNQSLLDQLVDEITSAGGTAISLACDATKENDVKALIAKCVEVYGSLDIMVCNAGIALAKPILETSIEEVSNIFDVNFNGVWHGYRLAAEQMIKQGKGGRIIGAASDAGKRGFPWLSAYSATKFAVRGLTQAAAQEWGIHGITVNAYCPGVIATPMVEKLGNSLSKALGQPDVDDPTEAAAKLTPMGRCGEPADVANLVSFFSSEKSSFITGQSYSVDGGSSVD